MGVEIPNLPNSKVEACKIILLTLLKKIKENIKETPEESKMYVKMLCVNMFTFDRVYKTPQEFMLKFKTFSDNMKQSIAMEKKLQGASFVLSPHINKYFDFNEGERKKINLGHGKYDADKIYKKASCELMVTKDVLLADLRGLSLHTSQKTHNQRFKSISSRAFKRLKLLGESDLSPVHKIYWKKHETIVKGVVDQIGKKKNQKKKDIEKVSSECKSKIGDVDVIEITDDILPKYINFEEGGIINKEVFDQGTCGSCWAMSLAGFLESRHAFRTLKQPQSLSRQQLVDCVPKGDCVSGNPAYALQYVIGNKMYLMDDYRKYNGKKKKKCEINKLKKPASLAPIKEFKVHKKVSHAELKFLLLKGPVIVQLDAKQFEFIYYRAGILKYQCGEPNHTLLLVGYMNANFLKQPNQSVTYDDYDKTTGDPKKSTFKFTTSKGYWILRNSWGKEWGTKGNVLIEMDPKWDACGLYLDVIEV